MDRGVFGRKTYGSKRVGIDLDVVLLTLGVKRHPPLTWPAQRFQQSLTARLVKMRHRPARRIQASKSQDSFPGQRPSSS